MNRVLKKINFRNISLTLAIIFISLVLFIIIYPNLPSTEWPYSIDKIVVLIFILTILTFFVRQLWPTILLAVGFIVVWFGIKFYDTNYDFINFSKDAQFIANDISGKNSFKNFVYTSYGSLYSDKAILKAIDYKNSVVRTFAIEAANSYFRKEQEQARTVETRILIQCFAVFKKINNNWNYVSDPSREDYFAKASESVSILAGDCDDYSILMAGAIKAIGGTVRLLCVKGHIYPEILIGTKENLNTIGLLIQKKLFVHELNGQQLNYHNDTKGYTWLNLDYTTAYPGGKFMGNNVLEYIYP
jgi:hypothetical protein